MDTTEDTERPGPAKPALHRHPEVARILEKMLIYHDLSIKIHRTISIYIIYYIYNIYYIYIYYIIYYIGHFPSGIWEFDPERWRFTHEKWWISDDFTIKIGDSEDIWICPTGKFIKHWDFSNRIHPRIFIMNCPCATIRDVDQTDSDPSKSKWLDHFLY